MNKITVGFVIQELSEEGLFVSQEFVASDEASWENKNGESVKPPEQTPPYLPFEMKQPVTPFVPSSEADISPEQKTEYIDRKGVKCPYCDSSDLNPGQVSFDLQVTQEITCGTCGKSWTDLYCLIDVLANHPVN